jgi:hypothetical protein
MKSFTYAIILLAATAVPPSIQAQSIGQQSTGQAQSTGASGKRSPEITGEVERAGAQVQLVLTNMSDARAFQGAAKISVGLSADAPIELAVNLGPNETRSFPLPASQISGASGAEYSLVVYNQARSPVLYKIAKIKTSAGNERAPAPKLSPAPRKTSGELTVTPKLTRGLASRDAEIPTPDQVEPYILTFEIESGTPIKDAGFSLSARDFQRRQSITIDGRADIEFKLPESLSERKLSYTLASSAGRTLASGEIDLDQLSAADAVSVGALTFDQPSYAPGESARATVEILGDAKRGYRMEFTVKDGAGNFLLKDERRGSNDAGKSKQEFTIEIPREPLGPIMVDYRVFGGQTGVMFDSGSREIIIKEAQEAKAGAAKRLSP